LTPETGNPYAPIKIQISPFHLVYRTPKVPRYQGTKVPQSKNLISTWYGIHRRLESYAISKPAAKSQHMPMPKKKCSKPVFANVSESLQEKKYLPLHIEWETYREHHIS
jgi:hypothetical protein